MRQKARTIIQLLAFILTIIGFFVNFKWTMVIIMAAIVIGGTFYCGWLCPYGTMQEFANKMARLLKIKQRKLPKSIHKYLKYFRYIVLILNGVITSSLIFEMMAFEPRNAFIALLTGTIPAVLAFVVVLSFIVISMVYERFYCNYFCYEGAKFGLMSLLRPVTLHRDEEKCIGCGKCDRVCSMNIEVSQVEVLRSPSCINCFKCMDACPVEDTLTYGFKPKKLLSKQYILLTSVAAIAVIGFIVTDGLRASEAGDNNSSETIMTVIDDGQTTTSDNAVSETNQTVESTSLYKEGTYTGEGEGFRGTIYVKVTVKSGTITDVTVTDHCDDSKWYNRAYSIVEDILNQQSTDVDLVGGATYSSEGIRDAVANALEKAK